MKLLVAVPCYNCQAQVVRVLDELDGPTLNQVHEVLVIDNRSLDQTLAKAQEALAKLARRAPNVKATLVQNVENYGLGGSHKVAFNHALAKGYDYIAILHGDNQAKSAEVSDLIQCVTEAPELDAVLGSRFSWGSRRLGYSLVRTVGNMGLNLVYTLLSGRLTADLGSGLNLFKVSSLRSWSYENLTEGFTFNMELLLNMYDAGARVRFVPITWREEDQVSTARTFRVGWKALKTLLAWRFGRGRTPIRRPYLSKSITL